MLFRKRDEYPSDAVNVFAQPVIFNLAEQAHLSA
jgi:hypothetical protein